MIKKKKMLDWLSLKKSKNKQTNKKQNKQTNKQKTKKKKPNITCLHFLQARNMSSRAMSK